MHPLADLQVPEGKVAIHWFEQSTYAIKDSAGTTAMVDPYFPTDRPAASFKYEDSPHDESTLPVDYVLLTHNHGDHTFPESLARIHESSPDIRCIGPKESIGNIVEKTSIPGEQVTEIKAGESCLLGSMKATFVYAKAPEGDPDRGINPPDVTHLGCVVDAGGIGMYFSGDVFNSFAERDDLIEAVAGLQPDIGFLTNHPTEGEFPFFDGSAKMAKRIGLKQAAPAHYECFVKRDYDPNEWAKAVAELGTEPVIIPRNSHIIYP
ncbi:MAG: MBL fold metallo-hydrolase [Planctomycetota bacterium]|jgi:L-ascorbate metabolism protein UlaG (beta-lactamase superfamily)|nr:MBL fold metallo-hydrolase [Planctomycetota bacterium]